MEKYQKVSKYYVHDYASGKNSVILDPYFGGVRAQKRPKKGHFVDAESVRKTLENFNLATTNAILMKLITISIFMSVNRKTLRARNSDFWLNFQ